MHEYIIVLIATILGAYIGKFLATVVHYLPWILLEEEAQETEPMDIFKWFLKGPKCWSCKKSLPWHFNLPIYGYLFKSKKCPHCNTTFGIQTLVLEVITAMLFGFSFLFIPLSYELLFVLFISCLLICCFVTDFEHHILPDQFTLTIVWVALLGSLLPVFHSPHDSILGAIAGYGLFWGINIVFRYFRHFDGIYPGDYKLNAGVGALFGWAAMANIVMLAMFILIVFTTFRALIKAIRRKKLSAIEVLRTEVPYGCFSSIITFFFLYILLLDKMLTSSLTPFVSHGS